MSHQTESGLAPCGSTLPFLLLRFLRFRALKILRYLQLFWLFWLSNIPSNHRSYLTILSPNPYQPSLVARYAPSNPPEPLFISILCGCYRLHRCHQILTSRKEILALHSSATSQHRLLATTTNATDVITDGMLGRNVIWYTIAYRRWGYRFLFSFVGMLSRYAMACSDGWARADYLRR